MKKQNDYQELLKDPKWISKRNQILSRDKNTCQFCGCQDRYMQVHHKRYIKGLSMTLLDTILNHITDAVTRQDYDGENASESSSYDYVRDCICGTQMISDIYAAKKCGFDLRDLMQNCFPTLINEYDKI